MKKQTVMSIVAAIALINGSVLYGGTEGGTNTYYGQGAGNAGGGNFNSFFGVSAGLFNTGSSNTFSGAGSGNNNKTGSYNTFSGYFSGHNNTIGYQNTFIGSDCGRHNTEGYFNTFIGDGSGSSNTTGHHNTFSGNVSGFDNLTGNYNTFSGVQSGSSNTTGHSNTFIGYLSGFANTTGSENTFIGDGSGLNADAGISKSVFLGNYAGYNATRSNTLYIDNSSTDNPLIYGEFDNDLVRINGNFEVTWAGSDTTNNHNLVELSSNNSVANSDVGFSLENTQDGHNGSYKWAFRTYEPSEGLSMTKIGTGGTEFLIENLGDDLTTTKLYAAGHVIFEDGHIVTASSRTLKTDIKPLDSQAAMDAFHKLQPVSYVYKAHKGEPVVGFIAEDVPELVAMPSRKSFDSAEIVAVLTKVVQEQDKVMAETRAELKAKDAEMKSMQAELKAKDAEMEAKIAKLESLLINLALDTSKTTKEKISFKLK